MEFIIKTGGERLDKAIKKQETEISRTRLQKLIEEGKVKVNGKIEKNSYIVKIGDKILIEEEEPEEIELKPQEIPGSES